MIVLRMQKHEANAFRYDNSSVPRKIFGYHARISIRISIRIKRQRYVHFLRKFCRRTLCIALSALRLRGICELLQATRGEHEEFPRRVSCSCVPFGSRSCASVMTIEKSDLWKSEPERQHSPFHRSPAASTTKRVFADQSESVRGPSSCCVRVFHAALRGRSLGKCPFGAETASSRLSRALARSWLSSSSRWRALALVLAPRLSWRVDELSWDPPGPGGRPSGPPERGPKRAECAWGARPGEIRPRRCGVRHRERCGTRRKFRVRQDRSRTDARDGVAEGIREGKDSAVIYFTTALVDVLV